MSDHADDPGDHDAMELDHDGVERVVTMRRSPAIAIAWRTHLAKTSWSEPLLCSYCRMRARAMNFGVPLVDAVNETNTPRAAQIAPFGSSA